MKTKIESLVEEALKKLAGSNLGETYTTNILTTLAVEASNGIRLGEVAEHKTSLELQMFKLK